MTELLRERGILSDGYHPELEKVHLNNARRLAELIRSRGFPVPSNARDTGVRPSWPIVFHAGAWPLFVRDCLRELRLAAGRTTIRSISWPHRRPGRLLRGKAPALWHQPGLGGRRTPPDAGRGPRPARPPAPLDGPRSGGGLRGAKPPGPAPAGLGRENAGLRSVARPGRLAGMVALTPVAMMRKRFTKLTGSSRMIGLKENPWPA
jgi:hypothetical protein